jgi:site-specific DNA-methyltransferase (adenine-specific)/modification methylase
MSCAVYLTGGIMVEPVIIGDCTLYLGDCLEILPTLQDAYEATALVTDPPYGIGESNEKALSRGKLANPIDYGSFDWDKKPANAAQIAGCRIRAKHQIIFGGNYFELPPTSCWLVWDKQNGTNDFADCELAWTNLNKAVRRVYWRWNGMIRRGDDVRVHPTQKPVGVMKWCIEQLPDTCSIILDPFMGSGTTGVACAKMGKKFIGIEREKQYFDAACERIRKAYEQPDMLIEPVVKPVQEGLPL